MEKWKDFDGHPYKKIHEENYCNTIFSTEPIELGKEKSSVIKDRFKKPEKIYARCYFPGAVGKVGDKKFRHELWIDGKLAKMIFFKNPPEPDWDTIQVWVSEDEYKSEISELSSGEHEVLLWVIKEEFGGTEVVSEKDSSGNIVQKEKEIWIPKRLSKGKIIYEV
ncbi:MAG: hypothetical protein JW891_15840 [Candidatus Lokiarchaeota archaeon]|nr:hypothetical protein [Candidatus Lokiarchaeota archaeon]